MKNQYGVLIKSNRAIEAESNGLLPYSKLKAWQKRAVERGAVIAREWHHTSGAANRTNYYNPTDFEDLDPNMYNPEKAEVQQQADLNRLKIRIVFDKMKSGFSSKRKQFEEVTVEGLDIRKSDNIIIGAGGRRLDSNNKNVTFLYKKPYAKNFKEITKNEVIALGYKLI